MHSSGEKHDRFIEYPSACIRCRAFIRMHNWMVDILLVLVGNLTVTGYSQQVHPAVLEGVYEPLSVEIDGLVASIPFLKLLAEAHDISVSKGISESEVCLLSGVTSSRRLPRLLKTVAKGNAEAIMIIL